MFFIQNFIIDLILLLQIKKRKKEKRKGECVCWFISEYVYFHTWESRTWRIRRVHVEESAATTGQSQNLVEISRQVSQAVAHVRSPFLLLSIQPIVSRHVTNSGTDQSFRRKSQAWLVNSSIWFFISAIFSMSIIIQIKSIL